jgi:hypothetical protein
MEGKMEKPEFDITGVSTRRDLALKIRKSIDQMSYSEQNKFHSAIWTCSTFDEWLSLAENWFQITGIKVVAEGENTFPSER